MFCIVLRPTCHISPADTRNSLAVKTNQYAINDHEGLQDSGTGLRSSTLPHYERFLFTCSCVVEPATRRRLKVSTLVQE